jgi:hypothetical protein
VRSSPCAYERHPGAASAALPKEYRRHEPDKTLLYQVVQTHLESFLFDARARSEHGFGVPRFVERELREYLRCGILAHGFARVRCDECKDEVLVGLSCKGRGICPSCTARRMHDTAAHLLDRVLPRVPIRQWVLAFPHRVRFLLSRDPKLLSAALTIFIRALFAFQRRRARAQGLPTTRAGTSGSVTFVQRFGSALQLTPHLHTLLPDGIFAPEPTGDGVRQRFVKLDAPDDEEVAWVLERAARQVDQLLAARGLLGTSGEPLADEPTDLLAHTLAHAMAIPQKTGKGLAPIPLPEPPPRTARYQGYSLHADVAVHENDRQGLERLCRYGLRPPLALERLTQTEDGRLRYRMKRTFSDGTNELILEPSELLRRLGALIPPPRIHLVRYHGVLAPNARARRGITRQGPSRRSRREAARLTAGEMAPEISAGSLPGDGAGRGGAGNAAWAAPSAEDQAASGDLGDPPDAPHRPRYLPWADLLRRVHEVDVLKCPRCPGRRLVLAFITAPQVVTAILAHLGLPSDPPALAPARAPPQEALSFAGWADDDFVDPPSSHSY